MKRGRPRLDKDDVRDKVVVIRVSSKELAAIEKAAGGEVSTWCREKLLRIAKRKRPPKK